MISTTDSWKKKDKTYDRATTPMHGRGGWFIPPKHLWFIPLKKTGG
jgi:hypothetical protein